MQGEQIVYRQDVENICQFEGKVGTGREIVSRLLQIDFFGEGFHQIDVPTWKERAKKCNNHSLLISSQKSNLTDQK